MEIFYISVFLFGLCIGSFSNVCIFRWVEEKSVVFPSSHCPNCGHSISWYDNIPVISYLLLKGKCRNCHIPISLQYPFIELLTGITFLAIFYSFGFSIFGLKLMFISWMFIVATMTDIIDRIIPNELILIGLVLIPVFFFLEDTTYMELILGLIFPSVILCIVSIIIEEITNIETVVGGGDLKFLFIIGGLMGYEFSMYILMGGCVVGTVVYFAYFIEDMIYKKHTYIPMMVPFSLAFIFALLFYYLNPYPMFY